MPHKRQTHRHNATCFSCNDTFIYDYFKKTGEDRRGQIHEGLKCARCRSAQKQSMNDKMDRYTWRSLTEIDATWGAVKKGELWEEALKKFTQSIPVSEEKQNKLFEALK